MTIKVCDICKRVITGTGTRYLGPSVKFGSNNPNSNAYVNADICMECHKRIRDKIKENRDRADVCATVNETDKFEEFWKELNDNNAEA